MDYNSEVAERQTMGPHGDEGGATEREAPSVAECFSKVAALAYARWESLRGEADLPPIAHDQRAESRLFTPNCVQVAWDRNVSIPTISYLGKDLAERLAGLTGAAWPNLPIESPLVVMLHDVSLRAIRERDAMEFDERIIDSEGRTRGIQGLALPFAGPSADDASGTFLVDVMFDLDHPIRTIAEPDQGSGEASDDILLLEQEFDPDAMPRPAQVPPQQPVLFVCVSDEDRVPPAPAEPDFPRSMARALALFSGQSSPTVKAKTGGRAIDVPLLLTDALEDTAEAEDDALRAPACDSGDHLMLSLQIARDRAAAASGSEERSHIALYRAIGAAYDFALAAMAAPDRLNRMIEEAGLTTQARAPMTPVVKLIFGADYDRTRLAEYATALSHALRVGLPAGSVADYLQAFDGGLKGVIRAERELRGKPETNRSARLERIEAKLRTQPVHDFGHFAPEGQEFALVIARRMPDGSVTFVGEVPPDDRLLCSAARKFLKK
jgi:hypothetical protein